MGSLEARGIAGLTYQHLLVDAFRWNQTLAGKFTITGGLPASVRGGILTMVVVAKNQNVSVGKGAVLAGSASHLLK